MKNKSKDVYTLTRWMTNTEARSNEIEIVWIWVSFFSFSLCALLMFNWHKPLNNQWPFSTESTAFKTFQGEGLQDIEENFSSLQMSFKEDKNERRILTTSSYHQYQYRSLFLSIIEYQISSIDLMNHRWKYIPWSYAKKLLKK